MTKIINIYGKQNLKVKSVVAYRTITGNNTFINGVIQLEKGYRILIDRSKYEIRSGAYGKIRAKLPADAVKEVKKLIRVRLAILDKKYRTEGTFNCGVPELKWKGQISSYLESRIIDAIHDARITKHKKPAIIQIPKQNIKHYLKIA